MKIRQLLIESMIVLSLITALVITITSIEIHYNISKSYRNLANQYLDSTFQIYKNQITGDLLIGDHHLLKALLSEIVIDRKISADLTYKDWRITKQVGAPSSEFKKYRILLGGGEVAIVKFYLPENFRHNNLFNTLVLSLLFEALVLSFGFFYLWHRFNRNLLKPLDNLAQNLEPERLNMHQLEPYALKEIHDLGDTLKSMQNNIQEKARFEAESKTAKQVGHDIRSPLASLTLLFSNLSHIPENYRVLMQSAIQRISDIANDLNSRAQVKAEKPALGLIEPVMISSLIDAVVSEKRIQYRDKGYVQIDVHLKQAYGLFTKVNSQEIKRVLSNLIDNSVEAFGNLRAHHVEIAVSKVENDLLITINDDGKGIPSHVLKYIGIRGYSYGKENCGSSGSGLGVNDAIEKIESYGGRFRIESKEYQGTRVSISLPACKTPSWFVDGIYLQDIDSIIIMDDDRSIHDLWQDRFDKIGADKVLTHYFSGSEFSEFISGVSEKRLEKTLLLIDYQLLNQNMTGLDLIKQFQLNKHAILVTSYDDSHIRSLAQKLGVRIIPKGIAAFVPILY